MCDLWSLGVVVFLLLVGYMPFPVLPDIAARPQAAQSSQEVPAGVRCVSTQEETELNILNGRYKYDARKWNCVSKSSFDFVSKLLPGSFWVRRCMCLRQVAYPCCQNEGTYRLHAFDRWRLQRDPDMRMTAEEAQGDGRRGLA